MIIISSGFPKSASTLLFLCTEHLIHKSGRSTGQKLFRKFNKDGFTPGIGPLNGTWYLLLSLFGPVVIKTHCEPGLMIRLLIRLNLACAYYSVRDPRDAALSALDHGKRAREQGIKTRSDQAFIHFRTLHDLNEVLPLHFKRFQKWKEFGHVIFPAYERTITELKDVLSEIVKWSNLSISEQQITDTANWFNSTKEKTQHFNTGKSERYIRDMNSEELHWFESQFSEMIQGMGYKTGTK